jgi:PAS domain S-box-containing protein
MTENVFSLNTFFMAVEGHHLITSGAGNRSCPGFTGESVAMTLLESIDLTVLINLVLSITVVAISIWGYSRIGKPTPLYFGMAYVLFALSHFVTLIGMNQVHATALIMLRTAGYILVAVGLFAIIRDIIGRQQVEQALREKEEHIGATFDQTAVGIAEFLPDGRIVRHNSKYGEILGIQNDDLQPVSIWDLITPDEHIVHFDGMNAVIRGDRNEYSGDMLFMKRAGQQVWCRISLSSVRAPEGRPRYFILVLDDISERKCAEEALAALNAGLEGRVAERTRELKDANTALLNEVYQRSFAEDRLKLALHEKEILLKEIHHRVKNNLQIIISLLFLQAKQNNDPATTGALMDSQTRVKSMALVHEKLYQSENLGSIDFAGYLHTLVPNLMVAYGAETRRIRVSIAAKDLPLSITTAIPLGLIMNELVSNSLKYAFPDGREGELSIEGNAKGDTMQITVRDNGIGIPGSLDWRYTESLGLHLVQMLTRQLRGTVDLSREGGTEFRFTIPVPEGS